MDFTFSISGFSGPCHLTLINSCYACLHVCDCLFCRTHKCLCRLICRRGRSGVRTTMSCSWQTSMPSRGNSTRQPSCTNALAMNPEPWTCTPIYECLTTPRWFNHQLIKEKKERGNKHARRKIISINAERQACETLHVLWGWDMCFSSLCAVMPSWGPVLCSDSPGLPSVFHLPIHHWNLYIHHPISTQTPHFLHSNSYSSADWLTHIIRAGSGAQTEKK